MSSPDTAPTPPTCAEHCPVRIFRDKQLAWREGARRILFGTEDGQQGMIEAAMKISEEVDRRGAAASTSLRDYVGLLQSKVGDLLDMIEQVHPFSPDLDGIASQCEGPQDNYAGLAFGFDAIRRCGSTAIDEATRRGCAQALQNPNPPGPPAAGLHE